MTDPTTPPVPLAKLESHVYELLAADPNAFTEHQRNLVSLVLLQVPALLTQAREAERLRVVREQNDSIVMARVALSERIAALESALRPLLGTREATPENVAEAVGHYVEAAAVLRLLGIKAPGRAADWLSADAARSGPEEKAK